MPLRKIAMGMMGAVMAVAAASAVGPEQHPLRHEVTPGAAQLKAFGARSAQQVASPSGSKFDPALAQIARHANKLRPGFEMQDLKNLNPGARFHQAPDGTPMVLIEATSRGNPLQLKSTLINMGLQRAAHFSNAVSGWLPVSQLDAVTQQVELHSIRAAMPYTRTGATTTQGDFVMNAPTVRSANSLSGNGVKVGILSDSYDCYATYAANGVPADGHNGYANENGIITTAAGDISTGDIPSNVTVNEESNTNTAKASNTCFDFGTAQLPFSDEGRAMMQIVHDVAPNASLNFYPAIFGQSDFANGVITMANQGAKIIADDVGYFEEPFFQDGVISQAITQVKAAGVAYFTAAGNNGNLAYDNPTDPAAPATTPLQFSTVAVSGTPGAGEKLLNFDATGGGQTTKLHVTVPSMRPGDFLAVVVQWDQPFVTGATGSPGASSQIDVCLLNVMGNDTVGDDNLNPLNSGNCTGANAVGADPLQVILVGNPASSPANSQPAAFDIQIGLANNTAAPKRIKVAVEGDGLLLGMSPFFTGASPTVQGHSMSADAISVGAALYLNTPACGVTPAVAEVYSSFGGGPILFDTTGTALTAPQVRQKPDLVGPDGGSDTFLGENIGAKASTTTGCVNGTTFPNFQGTSAATPHVAAVAALLLEADPGLTVDELYTILRQSTLSMAPASPNVVGAGFIQADIAATKTPGLVPPAPVLTLSAASIPVGGGGTLTWTSSNNQGCTASGAWSGAQPSNGTFTFTTTVIGPATFTLVCTNTAGTSSPASVTLDVVPPTPMLSIAPTSITVGGSAILTWTSTDAQNCSAGGAWTGGMPTSGTQTVMPTTTGSLTYTLTCANNGETSAAASVTLTVNAVPGHHGGGALDGAVLLSLAILVMGRAYQARRVHPFGKSAA